MDEQARSVLAESDVVIAAKKDTAQLEGGRRPGKEMLRRK